MSELQAALEFQVELSKFYNVDLFQRGYYQIRSFMKSAPKAPVKIEISLPKNSACNLVFPASIINGVAVSKTFHILYRNEDVTINDVIVFKVYMLVDSQRIIQSIEEADFQLSVELWFTDVEVGPGQMEKFQCISERVVRLHFCPIQGLHHHLQVLFDYFHLSVVSITIHAMLLALQQPYINLTRQQPKSAWSNKSHPTMESVLFGGSALLQPSLDGDRNNVLSPRLQQACRIHTHLCSILLAAYNTLQEYIEDLSRRTTSLSHEHEHLDCHQKLDNLRISAQSHDNEEELLQMIQTTIAQVCAQNVILWSQFVELVTSKDEVTQLLTQEHHDSRIKRLSEGFFSHHYQKHDMLACFEPSIHGHSDLASVLRNSTYFQSIPPLEAECAELDGDSSTLPIIFEDLYCENFHLPQFHLGAEPLDDRSDNCVSRSNSSRSGSSSSPTSRSRANRKKIPKNLKLETLKRPSSMYTQQISNQVAYEATSCTLVGYRKLDETTTSPAMELGTFSPVQTPSSSLTRPLTRDANLFPILSHDLRTHSHVTNMTTSGSLPELSKIVKDDCSREDKLGIARYSLCVDASAQARLDSLISGELFSQGMKESKDLSSNESNAHVSEDNQAESGKVSDSTCSKLGSETCDSVSDTELSDNFQSEINIRKINKDSSESDEGLDGPIENGYMPSSENSNSSSANNIVHTDTENVSGLEDVEDSPVDQVATQSTQRSPRDDMDPLTDIRSTSDSGYVDTIDTDTKDATNKSDEQSECTFLELLKEEHDKSLSAAASNDNADDSTVSQSTLQTDDNSSSALESSPKSDQSSESRSSQSEISSTEKETLPSSVISRKPISVENRPKSAIVNLRESSSLREFSIFESRIKQHLGCEHLSKAINFRKSKESFQKQFKYIGQWFSETGAYASTVPYFLPVGASHGHRGDGVHLIVCVHGLDGNSADLRLVRTYLEMALPGEKVDFLMSEKNQMDTFADFEIMTHKLVDEIFYHLDVYGLDPERISFIGHSLGNLIIRSALSHPKMALLLPKLHTYLSLSGPHLGTLYNSSGLVNMGMWFMQKWKKSGSLRQLSLKDHSDPRQTFLYKLSQKAGLEFFRNILLVGSQQDRYVPYHSSRIELCRSATRDSGMGSVYAEMVTNILQPIVFNSDINFIRYDVFHALPSNANTMIGRAAHIAVLDSELFIEKLLTVSVLKYFK